MFDAEEFIAESIESLKATIDDVTIIACSGGVDSTVAAVIANQAVGDLLHCVYVDTCLLYTSPSPRDGLLSRMPSSA